MTQPSIRLVAYESRDPATIFVAVPDDRYRYLKTDRSVAMVPCEQCKSTTGEPCKHRGKYSGGTHVARRIAARRISPKPFAPDVDGPSDPETLDFPPLDPL